MNFHDNYYTNKYKKNKNHVKREGTDVLGTFIEALDWRKSHESRTELLCNAHSSVTARSDHGLAIALSKSDMILPDGVPTAWLCVIQGSPPKDVLPALISCISFLMNFKI